MKLLKTTCRKQREGEAIENVRERERISEKKVDLLVGSGLSLSMDFKTKIIRNNSTVSITFPLCLK